MIFISSSSIKSIKISNSVEALGKEGFKNIELSGGTQPYDRLKDDLLDLKAKYDLNYLCHNYFPPHVEPFVLNLASLDEKVFKLSFDHLLGAIKLSKDLGAKKFGFHAGFLINIPLGQIGKLISKQEFFNKEKALAQYISALEELKKYSEKYNVALYIENNVLSQTNYSNFDSQNPFFFTDYEGMNESLIDGVKPLLDFAHLKVSCNVLNLNFKNELKGILNETDYVHLSENDGLADQNKPINEDSSIFSVLSPSDLKNKVITLEVYGSLAELRHSYENVQKFIQ